MSKFPIAEREYYENLKSIETAEKTRYQKNVRDAITKFKRTKNKAKMIGLENEYDSLFEKVRQMEKNMNDQIFLLSVLECDMGFRDFLEIMKPDQKDRLFELVPTLDVGDQEVSDTMYLKGFADLSDKVMEFLDEDLRQQFISDLTKFHNEYVSKKDEFKKREKEPKKSESESKREKGSKNLERMTLRSSNKAVNSKKRTIDQISTTSNDCSSAKRSSVSEIDSK